MIRDVTNHLFESMFMDVWPRPAAIVDFGINSQRHYEALHRVIREGEATMEQMNAALGDGKKLTTLVNSCPSNPHKGIVFATAWDELYDEDSEDI